MSKQEIDKWGSLFRLITPTLVAIIGTMIVNNLTLMNKNMQEMEKRLSSHTEKLSEIVYGLDNRQRNLYERVTFMEAGCCRERINADQKIPIR